MRTKAFMETGKKYEVIAKVFANGKVTIPMEVRDYLSIKDGDYLDLVITKIDIPKPEGKA